MWHMHEGSGWWMVFGGVIAVLFWITIISIGVWAITRLTRRGDGSKTGKKEALDIARERYARGDITKEEFDEIKKGLS